MNSEHHWNVPLHHHQPCCQKGRTSENLLLIKSRLLLVQWHSTCLELDTPPLPLWRYDPSIPCINYWLNPMNRDGAIQESWENDVFPFLFPSCGVQSVYHSAQLERMQWVAWQPCAISFERMEGKQGKEHQNASKEHCSPLGKYWRQLHFLSCKAWIQWNLNQHLVLVNVQERAWISNSKPTFHRHIDRREFLFAIASLHSLNNSSFHDKPFDFALTLISDKCLRFTLAFNKAVGDHYSATMFYSTDTIS